MLIFVDDSHHAVAAVTFNDVRRSAHTDTGMADLMYDVAPLGEFHDLLGEIDPTTHDRHLGYRIRMERTKNAMIAELMAGIAAQEAVDATATATFAGLLDAASKDGSVLEVEWQRHQHRIEACRERARRAVSARLAASPRPHDPVLRFYDQNNRCIGCQRHIIDPCAANCPRNPQSRRDAAMADLRHRRPHCNLDGPCDPDCPGAITHDGQNP